jgi:hypothetical protein
MKLKEFHQPCPECGGPAFSSMILAEKKDACYYKVKAGAKVWPSAYASGRLVQCRKKGAANYGNKSESLKEFAAGGGGDAGNYFRELASAWYNGAYDSGSLQKGIKTNQDIERLLQRGVVAPDGKTRKYNIDYNSDFDGVVIFSDDYYEHGDHDDTIDSRTGQKWGPYDYMEFSDDDLSESANPGQQAAIAIAKQESGKYSKQDGHRLREESDSKCPPATQDITLNLKNRQKAIDEYGYGPLNPDLPNTKFWMAKQDEWNLDSPDEAKSSLCGNCAAFDQRTDTLDCIAQGIGSDQGADDPTIDAGDLGYCRFLKFKCASRRTCDAWVTGGPLSDESGMAEAVDIGQEWMSDTELDQYVPDRLQQQWRELLGYDMNGNPSAYWANLTGGYEPDVNDPQHRALMVKVANKWFAAKKIPNVKFFDVKDADDELEWLVQIGQQGVAEEWSKKYKSSINCSHPKGFSQKAHCAGKKKHNEDIEMEMTCEDCGMCETHGDHSRDTLDEACWKGYHKEGMKELFGKTVPNCVKNTNEEHDELARILELGGVTLMEQANQQFDMIEEMVEQLAEQHGVDADVIWEDFESVDDDELLETAAWRRKEGKSAKGGLNAKGVASYRRENPGSKLQTAVTTKPSKLKKGSKAAKRRKSFCARMGGVKGPMKKPNGKPTRKALALRKWNC